VYASAARRGAPGALQVADRWHLTHNLADALERFPVRILATARRNLKAREPPVCTPLPVPPSSLATSASAGRLAARTNQRHAEIHELLAQGLTVSAIARRLKLDRKTVRRFTTAAVATDLLGAQGRRTTALDAYLPYLATRWQEGQHVAAFLFDEVWQRGYRGSKRTVRRQLAGWRTTEPPPPAHVMLPGPWMFVWLLLRRPSDLDEEERAMLNQVCEWSTEVVSTRKLAQHFMRLVRERRGYDLDAWVADVHDTGPPELRGFSHNLRRDWNAVRAGLTERWNSGCVEGHVNKLKVVKRQMFGRAKFDLLRKRVLLAN